MPPAPGMSASTPLSDDRRRRRKCRSRARDQAVAGVDQDRIDGLAPRQQLDDGGGADLGLGVGGEADLGMPPMMAESPMTWMPGCKVDSKATGSTGHQPVRSATPAIWAMVPASAAG